MESRFLVAQMRDVGGTEWDVELRINGTNQPIVCVSHAGSPEHTYLASSFVGLGGHEAGFRITPSFDDEPFIVFSNDQWLVACRAVRKAIPWTCGELDVRWIPNDPNLPF